MNQIKNLKIISGQNKGYKIKKVYSHKSLRPTKIFVKEILFNWLSNYINNTIVCDLFSGSGSLGLESCSRKAKMVFFIEINKKYIKAIKQNIINLNYKKKTVIKNTDAINFIKNNITYFDIIFIDPPFKTQIIDIILNNILINSKYYKNSILYLETEYPKNIKLLSNFIILKYRKWKNIQILIIKINN